MVFRVALTCRCLRSCWAPSLAVSISGLEPDSHAVHGTFKHEALDAWTARAQHASKAGIDFLNANREDVLASRHQAPREMAANSVLVGRQIHSGLGHRRNTSVSSPPGRENSRKDVR